MARKLKEMNEVDESFALTGPNQNTIRQPIAASSAAVFACLVDGPAWSEWLGVDVEWTSPEPFGVGTTRTATVGGQKIHETFLAWDEGERMNFWFNKSTLPVSAFAEDYRVISTGDDLCELVWSYAFEWGGPLEPIASRIFAFGFAANSRRGAKKLAALVETDPARFLP